MLVGYLILVISYTWPMLCWLGCSVTPYYIGCIIMAALKIMLFLCYYYILFWFLAYVIVVVAGNGVLRTNDYRDDLGLLNCQILQLPSYYCIRN